MTILLLFQMSNYRNFKHYYIDCISGHLRNCFPKALSYNRFVEVMGTSLMPLSIFLQGVTGKETNVYYADSTSLKVCHIKRANSHKVFKGLATKGKNSMGWFFGFKLHLVINTQGEIMSCKLTTANTDDRQPVPK